MRNGDTLEATLTQPVFTPSLPDQGLFASTGSTIARVDSKPQFLEDDRSIEGHLVSLAKDDASEVLTELLRRLQMTRTASEMKILVNTISTAGRSLLMLAASQSVPDAVSSLLELGADANTQADDGQTALDCATDAG